MYRLLYRSLAVRKLDEAELHGIVNACERNNNDRLITGLLSYDGTHFFQMLEGKRENVTSIMHRIESDDRHRNIRVLGQRPVSERAYLSWGFRWDRGQSLAELEDAMRFDGVNPW